MPKISGRPGTTYAAAPAPKSLIASRVQRLFATENRVTPALLRVALGAIMFPHGAQHALGWFGGYGFAGTHSWMTESLGFPAALATLAIVTELIAPVALIVGLAGRVAAVGITGLMIGATATHLEHGFFMNWFGTMPSGAEGFEYHLLVIAMCLAVVIDGSGTLSADRALMTRHA